MTYLCVAIFVRDENQARRDIAIAAEAGADLVELRVDEIRDAWLVRRVVSASTVPCILTMRPHWEGGRSCLDDSERLEKMFEMVEISEHDAPAYIDLELAAVKKLSNTLALLKQLARDERPGIIFSSHDFQGRPPRLLNLAAELNDSLSDVAKIVWTARTVRDNLEAFELLRLHAKPTIALCMGEAGLISRILAKKFGAFLTFASLDSGGGTAPGQISIHDMKRLYRWNAINPATKVYGVVGSPVAHSMSPAIHNAAFEEIGFDGVYVPLLVEKSYESFKAFMESFLAAEGLDLCGLSITLPHKENALRYLQEKGAEIDPIAERIGAVNTIVIDRGILLGASQTPVSERTREDPDAKAPSRISDLGSSIVGEASGLVSHPQSAMRNPQSSSEESGSSGVPSDTGVLEFRLRGTSTDYAAILDSITEKLGIAREALKGYRIAVIGAGGTGRTAVAALAHYGATVVIYNRTRERADALAAEFTGKSGKVVAADMGKLCNSCCQIYINTTSIGMSPNVDQSPFGDRLPTLSADTVVFDAVYNPIRTRFLQQAETAGAKTISGLEMFVRQAAGQFEAWTGTAAPMEVMLRVVESRLALKEEGLPLRH